MKRLWIMAFFVLGVCFAAVWVADHPGSATLVWEGWRIDASVAFLLGVVIVVSWLLAALYAWSRDLAGLPKRFGERQKLKHYREGMAALTRSVAAFTSADILDAERHARKAERLLGQTPLGLLIAAQIAKTRGETDRARALFSEMLAHEETKKTAQRLLSNEDPKKSQEYTWGSKFRSFVRKR
jgi:HemY protein